MTEKNQTTTSTSKRLNEESSTQEIRKRRKKTTANVLTTLLLTCLILPLTTTATTLNEQVEVRMLSNQPGIYYERLGNAQISSHEWKWFIYYNMTDYWNMLNTIKKSLNKLNILANASNKQEYFQAIVTQYQHTITEIEDMNNLLLSHHGMRASRRSKRGLINAVGSLAHQLFGVLDEEYANTVTQTIQKVQQNEDHIYELLKNQTTVLEATETIIKQSEHDRITQLKNLERSAQHTIENMNNMTIEMRNQRIAESFLTIATFLTLLVTEYQKIQAALVDTITDVHNEKMNHRIMTAEKLRSQIRIIAEHLPATLNLPSKDVARLYHMMTVQCDVNEDYIIFVVQLPLALNVEFELYKPIPLPSLVNNTHVAIKPRTEILMVNLQRDMFYELSTLELSHCTMIEELRYLCPQLHPIFSKKSKTVQCDAEMINQHTVSDQCTILVSSPRKIWIQLTTSNQWLFALDKEYVYNIVCQKKAFQRTLSGTGIIKLQKGCTMKDDHVVITSHTSYESNFNATFQPRFNLSDNLSIPKKLILTSNSQLAVSYHNHSMALQRIHEQLWNIHQQQNPLQRLQSHDIHQYSVGYSALCLTLIIGLCLGLMYFKRRTSPRPPVPAVRLSRPQGLSVNDFRIEVNNAERGEDVTCVT